MRTKVRGLAATYEDETGERVEEPFEIEIPNCQEDYADIFSDMSALLRKGDLATHQQWMRALVAADLYFLTLMSSVATRLDPYRSAETGEEVYEVSAPFIFEFAREVQFDSDDVLDTGARGHWKSTLKLLMLPIQIAVIDVNAAMGVFSFEKAAAAKHTQRWADELVLNPYWTRTFPDAFGTVRTEATTPRLNGAPLWDKDKGHTIPGRTVSSQSPTMAPYTFLESLPTGGRLGYMFFDDVESDRIVRNPDTVKKAIDSLHSALRLQGRGVRRFANGTFHSATALLAHMAKLSTWRVRCYAIVDTEKPAPPIPAEDPLTGKPLPDFIRAQDIEGEPRLFHPVEVAKIRAEHEQGGKLDDYYRHYHGDVTKGQRRRLSKAQVQFYEEDARQLALSENMHIVTCLDPARGGDPHYHWVWGITWDRRYYWLDAEVRVQEPSARRKTVHNLVVKWKQYGRVVQARVETFGAATVDIEIAEYLRSEGIYLDVEPVRDNRGAASAFADFNEGGKLSRAYDRWQPPLADGKIYFPRRMMRQVDDVTTEDVVERFLTNELEAFPHCKEDHGLDSGGLVFHVDHKVKAIPLPARPRPQRFEYHGMPTTSWRSA